MLNRNATRIYWTGNKFLYGDDHGAWMGDHVEKVKFDFDRDPDGINGTWGLYWIIEPKEVG